MTYTYETLRYLKRKHPGEKLYFLCGSDALATLSEWARPREVARNCTFLVGRRPGMRLPSKIPAQVLPGAFPLISSTDIRLRLLLDTSVKSRLTDAVKARIRKHGLYGVAILSRLKSELKPGRYAHTLAVARHATDLATRHGLDPEQAALAGLLHDCGRAVPMPRMAAFIRRNRICFPCFSETALRQPMLMHAHASEFRARRVYGIHDETVLSAIRKHTLGDPAMAPLDRLLYAADASSADRAYPGVAAIRATARRNIDEGFAAAVRSKLADVINRGQWLHPLTASVWNEALEHL